MSRVLSEEELIASYLEVARQDVSDLEEMVSRLRDDPDAWQVMRQHMYHTVHNVKGQGTSFGYPLMTRIGDSLMRLVKASDERSMPTLPVVEAHVTALRTIMQHDIRGPGGAPGEALANKLEAMTLAVPA